MFHITVAYYTIALYNGRYMTYQRYMKTIIHITQTPLTVSHIMA
jgi:hypothetical protein